MTAASSRRPLPSRAPATRRAGQTAPTGSWPRGIAERSRHRAPLYRVRTAESPTPPGVHLVNRATPGGPAHGRPRARWSGVMRQVLVALTVVAVAVLLVTGIEVVLGHPLSGGDLGHTSLGEVLHPGP